MEEEGRFDYLDRDPHEINRYLTVKIEKKTTLINTSYLNRYFLFVAWTRTGIWRTTTTSIGKLVKENSMEIYCLKLLLIVILLLVFGSMLGVAFLGLKDAYMYYFRAFLVSKVVNKIDI